MVSHAIESEVKDALNLKFKVELRGEKSARIEVMSDIGDALFEEGVSAKSVSEEMAKMKGVKQIEVAINSFGGQVSDALAIYQLLRQHPAEVTTNVLGYCMSAATIVALAGDRVVTAEEAVWMIHKPMAGAFGNVDELQKAIDFLNTNERAAVKIYGDKTGLPEDRLSEMLKAETTFTGAEAKDMGFADEFSGDEPVLQSNEFEALMTGSRMGAVARGKISQMVARNLARPSTKLQREPMSVLERIARPGFAKKGS